MMEVDHISYIFGSFSRRRQSHDVSAAKRRSVEPPKIVHDRSKSTPHTPKKADFQSPSRAKSVCNVAGDDAKYKCPMCQKHFIEPRVLPCLHTFCTKCLQELESNEAVWNNGSEASSGSGNGSGGSGYSSDKIENEGSWCRTTKSLTCPTCRSKCDIPQEGISSLPLNYLVQHRMVLATLNAHTTKLLCDLCATDVTALSRCSECAISLCAKCSEGHRRQRGMGQHEILSLDDARRRGITKVRRQVMCSGHPEKQLAIFCSTCSQVICRDCASSTHRNHTMEPASKAAKSQTSNIRIAVDRARSMAEKSLMTSSRLDNTSKRIESQCNQIHDEIERFTENYIRAVQQHQRNLYQQLNQAKTQKMQVVDSQKIELHKRLRDTKDVMCFADELLREGTDVEVLSFVKPIMKKLELCYKLDGLQELRFSESLQFLPDEAVQVEDGIPLYGVITTQTVSVKNCVIHTEGLQNLRVGRRGEVILETRDLTDGPLQRGGEQITAELKHRDGGTSRTLQNHIEDLKDGTYRIYFVPDVAGKLLLSIYVKGQPLKENPIPIHVRTLRPHHGTFHCCSFCSSGGSKEAACGCGGKMPGGYRGCGHGHEGHPGRRHWSCCGNVLEHSECVRTNSITHYQYTL